METAWGVFFVASVQCALVYFSTFFVPRQLTALTNQPDCPLGHVVPMQAIAAQCLKLSVSGRRPA